MPINFLKGFGRPDYADFKPKTRRAFERLFYALDLWLSGAGSVTVGSDGLLQILVNPTGLLETTSTGIGLHGISTTAQGDILFISASNVVSVLNKNTNATRYLSNTGTSNNPAWAQVDLTTGVTGVLPSANGGVPQSLGTGSSPTFVRLILSQATGTAPLSVSSTTLVSNLNAEMLDGQHGVFYTTYADTVANTAEVNAMAYADAIVITDHGGLTGLSDDDHTQYALLAGRSGGQTVTGGTASGEDLTLNSTSHSTKGSVFLAGGLAEFDQNLQAVGIGGGTPAVTTVMSIGGNPTQASRYKVGMGGSYTDTSGTSAGALWNLNADPSGASSAVTYGIWGEAGTSTGNSQTITGSLIGVRGSVRHRGTGTLTTSIALYCGATSAPGTGTTITTAYGVYIEKQSVAGKTTNTFAIYQVDSGDPSYFAGNVGFGNSSPTTPVYVQVADNGTAVTILVNATQANVTAADTFIDFRSTTGSEGSIAGTAVAGVLAYNTFTGSHYTQVIESDRAELRPLMLLEIVDGEPTFQKKTIRTKRMEVFRDAEDNEPMFDDLGKPVLIETESVYEAEASPKSQLFMTRICRTAKSRAAIGVWGGQDKEGRDMVLSMGTGMCFLANRGKNLEIGDLLQSSNVAGHVELQADDVVRNTTVAILSERVVWGAGETARTVRCIYKRG